MSVLEGSSLWGEKMQMGRLDRRKRSRMDTIVDRKSLSKRKEARIIPIIFWSEVLDGFCGCQIAKRKRKIKFITWTYELL